MCRECSCKVSGRHNAATVLFEQVRCQRERRINDLSFNDLHACSRQRKCPRTARGHSAGRSGGGRRPGTRVERHSMLSAIQYCVAKLSWRHTRRCKSIRIRMAMRLPSRRRLSFLPRRRLLRKTIRMNDIALPVAADATPQRRWLIPLALLAVYVIWGSTYLGIRIGLTGFPPFALAAIRFFAAGIAMYAWLRLRGVKPPTRRQWRNAAITGVLLLLFGNGLVCFAEQSVTSGIAAVAIASEPLFVALVLFAYRERPSRSEIIGLVVGFVGVIVLNSGGAMRAAPLAAAALIFAT